MTNSLSLWTGRGGEKVALFFLARGEGRGSGGLLPWINDDDDDDADDSGNNVCMCAGAKGDQGEPGPKGDVGSPGESRPLTEGADQSRPYSLDPTSLQSNHVPHRGS